MTAQPAPLLFSTVFGALMAVTAAGPGAPGRIAAAAALAGVAAGVFYRPAAVPAVLAAVAALGVSAPSVPSAAVCGLSATVYLVIRHAVGSDVVTTTAPTVLGMLGFTAAAVVAAIVPWRLAWVPLLGPVVVVAIVVAAGAGLFRPDPVRYE